MALKRTLGRGLDALIPASTMSDVDAGGPAGNPPAAAPAVGEERVHLVPLAAIQANPFQPRSLFNPESLQELVNSIKEHGVLQPVLLRPIPNGPHQAGIRYQLVAGERRWRAAQAAGLATVPALVREASDQYALEQALVENAQREDIRPLDAARAYQRLASEFGMQQQQIAERVGKSRVAVSNTLRLLDLPLEVRQALEEGIISEGHGRAILLAEGEGARRAVFRAVLREGLSVRRAEQLAREAAAPTARVKRAEKPAPDGNLLQLEQSLQRLLGTRLRIKTAGKGGRIVIDYFSPEDLQRLVTYLGAERR